MGRRSKRRKEFTNVPVVDIGSKGKSVAKTEDGTVIFLKNAIPGDVVDIQTFKKRKGYYEGNATQFHQRSERRVEPVCKHFGTCGGCKWQHMGYVHQLYFKEKQVVENLKRIGNLDLLETSPIIGVENPYYYRNKMEFSFSSDRWLTEHEISSRGEITDKRALGFHIPGMWDKVLDLDECHLHPEIGERIRGEVAAFAKANNLSFYSLREKTGLLRSLMLRMASTGEVMVVIQFYEDDKDSRETLLDHIKAEFPEVKSLQYIINDKANDSIYDQKVVCYHGRDHIFEQMGELKFKLSAKAFYQTNSKQAETLYHKAAQLADISSSDLVYDLYTGTGTIAQFIAGRADRVVGIESVPDAILDARENATMNGLENTTFITGDMRYELTDDFVAEHGKPDVIITDPPRNGMHKKVVAQLLKLESPRIIYVSCNSATQARDLSELVKKYSITAVQPVDMFPQTQHVENIVRLDLNDDR